jgi:SusD family.
MKKFIIKLSLVLVIVMCCFSCSDMLDAEDDGRIEFDVIFSNRYKIESYYNSCITALIGPDLRSVAYCDEGQSSSFFEDNSVQLWYSGQITASNHSMNPFGGDPWSGAYSYIRRCNIFLENIEKETAGLVADEKAGWTSEVYAMRGYYYWQLAKRYGGVPIFLEPLAATHDFSSDTKASFSDVVRQVIADCEKALEGPDTPLGYAWGYQDRLSGHLTPAGTHAVMSQAVTYAISPLWYDGSITKEYAVQITGRALYECLSHGYELFTSTSAEAQNAYALYFLTTDDKRSVDKETIYRVGGQQSIWQNCGLPTTPGQTTANYCPTQNLVDSYEMQATGLAPITGYSDKTKLIPKENLVSGYDPQNPYLGRDPRFDASIYYNGSIRYLNNPEGIKVETFEGGNEGIRNGDKKYSPTGYYLRKYNHYDSKQGNNKDGTMRQFRLAELYLNFAEAAYQSQGPDVKIQIGPNMSMSARDAVNAVRARAGMPAFPEGMSTGDFENKYRNERRVELAFEGHRPFDVRRWKILNETDSFISGMRIEQGSTFTYSRFNFEERKCNTDKFLMFPIDKTELYKIQKQTGQNWQNPGWDF